MSRAGLLIAVLAALLLAGCGNDGSSKVENPEATTATALTPPGEKGSDGGAVTTSTE